MARIAAILKPMAYRHVAVFELSGDFIGYAVMEQNALKLQSTNLYAEEEGEDLAKRIAGLNDSQAVTSAWPDARDPEVQALVDDPSFEPIEMSEEEVVDNENSYIVYLKDAEGEDTFEVDQEASVLKYKIAKVPVRPSDVMNRTKQACEVVARRRAG
jgi:hypothetical protein